MEFTEHGLQDKDLFIPFTTPRMNPKYFDCKTVEFKWSGKEGTGEGIGQIIAHRLGEKVAVEITHPVPSGDKRTFTYRRYALSQAQVDAIEIHPEAGQGEPPKPEFRMLA